MVGASAHGDPGDAAVKLRLTSHAVDRYLERVKPALTPAAARQELLALLRGAVVTDQRPGWAKPSLEDCSYVEISDGIAACVQSGSVTTVLVRAGLAPEHRQRRKEAKRKKRAERNWNNNKREPGARLGADYPPSPLTDKLALAAERTAERERAES
jgi:hypothetical protein